MDISLSRRRFVSAIGIAAASPSVPAIARESLAGAKLDRHGSLQEAIDSTPPGGTLVLPVGEYHLAGDEECLLLIDKPINLVGEGIGTRLVIHPSVPNTTDVILVRGDGKLLSGLNISDLSIEPLSGTPARNAIRLDASDGDNSIYDSVLTRLHIGEFGAEGIAVIGPAPPRFDGVFTTTISECSIGGGLLLKRAGDSLNIVRNKIWGRGGVLVDLIGKGSNTAHGFAFMFNNVTCQGGIRVVNSWQGAISYNNIELYGGAYGSNGAVIDLDGNAAIPPENFEIRGNFIGSGAPDVYNCIRVNQASGARIEANMLPRGAKHSVVVTPKADRTNLLLNRAQPYGELIETWLLDEGQHTVVVYNHPNTGRLVLDGSLQTGPLAIGAGPQIKDSSYLLQYVGEVTTGNTDTTTMECIGVEPGAICNAVPLNQEAAWLTGVYAVASADAVTLIHSKEGRIRLHSKGRGARFAIYSSITPIT